LPGFIGPVPPPLLIRLAIHYAFILMNTISFGCQPCQQEL